MNLDDIVNGFTAGPVQTDQAVFEDNIFGRYVGLVVG